jgi:hypothetical protein
MRRATASLLILIAIVPLGIARGDDQLVPYVGALHEHSSYSDGWPGSTPATYYESGKRFGLDFMGGSDHSDTFEVPFAVSDYCIDDDFSDASMCALADGANSFRKWDATLEQARAASSGGYTAWRGLEWTSDVFGHINVYFSRNTRNAKLDGGYGVTMETFWAWFLSTDPTGGADGIATFNHPGDKCSFGDISEDDPYCDWNHFEYRPEADDRMVGIELFNGTKEFGRYYVEALDAGWHVGAVGAEDKGHDKDDRWGGPEWAKTVILAMPKPWICPQPPADLPGSPLTCAELVYRNAMLARHTYAVQAHHNDVRIDFVADGQTMGARLQKQAGQAFALHVGVTGASVVELVSNGGQVVATSTNGVLDYAGTGTPQERYYFARVLDGAGHAIAFSSPVWVKP